MTENRTAALSFAAVALGVAGCVTIDNDAPQQSQAPPAASATLLRGDGVPAGSATLARQGSGWVLRVRTRGLPPGYHGMHLHAIGRCDPPDFASAGAHWNPGGRMHGSANPAGMHAGDLPNLPVGANGQGIAVIPLNSAAASADLAVLLDADGAALVIHAAADDLRSDPSGNSGPRIACGVLRSG